MNYWLDLFTGTTWKEFRDSGATVSGFRERMRRCLDQVEPGDILLCYLTGVMRWVGALEVVGPSKDSRRIWKDAEFPVRFTVKPLILLDVEHGIPMKDFEGKLDFYAGPEHRGKFKGFVRQSPNRFRVPQDGDLILQKLRVSQANPVARAYDPKKLARKPLFPAVRKQGKKSVETVVSVPERDEVAITPEPRASAAQAEYPTQHTEIQYHLLRLGSEMGFDVWVARNDRSKTWNGTTLGTMPGIVSELPTQFNDATTKTIELIDVLWLRGNSIVAAFEVECTTSVYSGLLRMSDLLALQPNLDIKLYLVAPDERGSKVEQEILRPTFALRDRPLAETCGFIAFSEFLAKVTAIQKLGLSRSLKPEFLENTAHFFRES